MRYRLDSDDDGHWYIVPDDKHAEFDAYIFDPDMNEFPEGIIPVNGHPSLITFENWEHE